MSHFRLLIGCAIAACAAACGDSTAPNGVKVTDAPEHANAVLQPGVIATEQIDPPPGPGTKGDVDTFTFDVPAGADAELYLQKLDTGNAELGGTYTRNGGAGVVVRAGSSTDDFETFASPRLQPGHYQLEVDADAFVQAAGEPDYRYRGAYQLEVKPIDSLPEHAAPQIIPGQLIANESIDDVGDADNYTLTGTAGTQYNAYVSNLGNFPFDVRLDVFATGVFAAQETVAAVDTTLMNHPIGQFTMPASGRLNVRVSGPGAGPGVLRGGYHLLVTQVSP